VKMDKEVQTFNNFMAIGYNETTGGFTILQYTDTLTLGQMAVVLNRSFLESYNKLPDRDKLLIDAAINGGKVIDRNT
jgi:hypothetical protein